MSDQYAAARHRMVRQQIVARGVSDQRILSAFETVPRHRFIPQRLWPEAYEDHPVPIGEEQTVSQPFIVAEMIQILNLRGGERVLEIGTGSGYQTALLAEMGCEVFTVERIASLQRTARAMLGELGYEGIRYCVADGTLGWPEHAPYDRITVGAAAPHVPGALAEQLADGGRLIIPVGERRFQQLTLIERRGEQLVSAHHGTCVFVPLLGEQGWS